MKKGVAFVILIILGVTLYPKYVKHGKKKQVENISILADSLKFAQKERLAFITQNLAFDDVSKLQIDSLRKENLHCKNKKTLCYETQSFEFKIDSLVRLEMSKSRNVSYNKEIRAKNKRVNSISAAYNKELKKFEAEYGFLDRIIVRESSFQSFERFDLKYGHTKVDPLVEYKKRLEYIDKLILEAFEE